MSDDGGTYLKNSLERTTLEVRKYQTGFLGGLGLVGRGVFPLAGCNAEKTECQKSQIYIQGRTIRLFPGCENAADKLRLKW